MRNLHSLDPKIASRDLLRERLLYGEIGDHASGVFRVRKMSPSRPIILACIASSGEGWDHVSVSLEHREPTWSEMTFVAGLFFEPHECLVQYRPPQSAYVNFHPFCLHWWRPLDIALPMPPIDFV